MPASTSITRRQLLAGTAAAVGFQQLGCASPVPGGNGLGALSGKSLQVQLMFGANINPAWYYYFLINNSNSSVATYPVPVGSPVSGTTYGNGFATGNDGQSAGFTDFVLYSTNQYPGAQPNNGFALYHVVSTSGANAGNSASNFIANGAPLQVLSPLGFAGSNVIAFNLDLAQLFEYPNTTTSQNDAKNQALALTWIQVNVVATNTVPLDNQTSALKYYDSFGNDSNGVGSYLNMNLIDGGTTYAANAVNCPVEVPGDVFATQTQSVTNQFPALDLTGWQILIGND